MEIVIYHEYGPAQHSSFLRLIAPPSPPRKLHLLSRRLLSHGPSCTYQRKIYSAHLSPAVTSTQRGQLSGTSLQCAHRTPLLLSEVYQSAQVIFFFFFFGRALYHTHKNLIDSFPGLMYHPYFRPLTTPIATLLSLSSSVQRYITSSTGGMIPVPSSVLRSIPSAFSRSSSHGGELTPPSPLESIANALEIPPLHVDQVAKAILLAIADTSDLNDEGGSPRRVLGVKEMEDLLARDAAEESSTRGAGTTTTS
jgi:hypothetical protein